MLRSSERPAFASLWEQLADVAMNPLDPCGACMEWLKKISEVNPDFRVLTFTSTNCEKVFITPIGDYA